MSFFTGWLMVLLIGLVAVISPGSDFVLTLRSSLTYSMPLSLSLHHSITRPTYQQITHAYLHA